MELKTKIDALSSKYESLKNRINTEEATKTAFVLPFINALGYDIFNPIEVVPEFTADVGLKKVRKSIMQLCTKENLLLYLNVNIGLKI